MVVIKGSIPITQVSLEVILYGPAADKGFFFGCSEPPPLRLSAIFVLYSNPQMLIFPCPLKGHRQFPKLTSYHQ